MSKPTPPAEPPTTLRSRAAMRLGRGSSGCGGAGPLTSYAALAVLHDLAANPATAADALALLHELQVHQVELDLQAEELRESRAELEAALRRQIDLYDSQPVGCFSIDGSSLLRELNLSGATLLGVDRDEACGLRLDSFLSADSARRLHQQIARLAAGQDGAAATLQLVLKHGARRRVQAHFALDPTGDGLLVVLAPAADEAPDAAAGGCAAAP